MRVALLRRSECVPKKLGSNPMPAIHWLTNREYCRVVIGRSRPRRPQKRLPRLLVGGCDVTVDRLSGLFRQLEPDRLAGLLLTHGCPIHGMTMGSNVFD